MEGIGDVLDSVRAHLRARFTNPLYGAYLVAWCIVNFRLLLVMTGEGTWREKIEYIDHDLYGHAGDWLRSGLLYPLGLALLLVLTSPFITRYLSIYLRSREKVTIERLLNIAGETPISPEESEKLQAKMIRDRLAHRQEVARLQHEVDDANATVEALRGQLEAARSASAGVPAAPVPDATSPPVLTAPQGHYTFAESEFVGGDQVGVLRLVEVGLEEDELRVLYLMRDGEPFAASDLVKRIGLKDVYSAQVLLDRLHGFRLTKVSPSFTGNFEITQTGRQALAAALKKGFQPEGLE